MVGPALERALPPRRQDPFQRPAVAGPQVPARMHARPCTLVGAAPAAPFVGACENDETISTLFPRRTWVQVSQRTLEQHRGCPCLHDGARWRIPGKAVLRVARLPRLRAHAPPCAEGMCAVDRLAFSVLASLKSHLVTSFIFPSSAGHIKVTSIRCASSDRTNC